MNRIFVDTERGLRFVPSDRDHAAALEWFEQNTQVVPQCESAQNTTDHCGSGVAQSLPATAL